MSAEAIKAEMREAGSPERATSSAWFFKTGPGQYGEGEIFIGLTMPQQRVIAKRHLDLSLPEVEELLRSPEHEFRMTALLIWTYQYPKADDEGKQMIYDRYLANTKWINNWDLVDGSAEFIVGPYLQNRDKSILIELANSESIWERRIAMLATFRYIKQHDYTEALKIAEILVNDPHDLIHKAVGWMLREIDKKGGETEEEVFLQTHYRQMPRTMLRYAIERFPEKRRLAYLKGTA